MTIRSLMASFLSAVFLSTSAWAISEGDVMPAVEIKAKDTATKLDWSGKVTVLNFWATWCEACKVELKEMSEQFAPLHARSDVLVAYVSLDKEPEKAKKYLNDTFGADSPVAIRIAHDPAFIAADKIGVDSFPMTIVLDKSGKVVKVHKGFKEGEGSTAAILKAALAL
jgi:thiol-disulfide isomerase/thioredoxin